VCQARDAVKALIPLWIARCRCSRERAEAIATAARRTQERNTRAARCHRATRLADLHAIGVFLGDCRRCYWPRK
jgi:hypothetical protein